jgi:hypothetical protein
VPCFEIGRAKTASSFTLLGRRCVRESDLGTRLAALRSAMANAAPELDLVINDLTRTHSP